MQHKTNDQNEFFPAIGKIRFEGRDSDNPLAYKWYDEDKLVAGKSMKDHLRFAVCYWHTFCNTGADPFGPGTKIYPWDAAADPVQRGRRSCTAGQRQDGRRF